MALREGTSALQWAATRPEDITLSVAVAVGHFVQVGQRPVILGDDAAYKRLTLLHFGARRQH
jgi:hypothetical protein